MKNPDPVDGTLIGYARVSTEEQKLDLQTDALKRAGVADGDIYVEKTSGASKRRPELDKAIKTLREGDTLVVWRLDRLGRNLMDLLRRIENLNSRKVKFKSLTESIDTGTITGQLLLHILGAIAQFERQLTQERTRVGMKAKQERGGKYGRPVTMDLERAKRLLSEGMTVSEVAREIGASRSAVHHHFKVADARRLHRAWLKQKAK